jgi:hypothetical protein
MTWKFMLGVFFAAVFVAVGALGVFFPRRVRAFYVDNFRRAMTTAKLEDFSFVLEKIPGAWFFRLYGAFSWLTAALIILGLYWR